MQYCSKSLSEDALQITEKEENNWKKRQGRKYPFECRVPKNSKKRYDSLP